MSRAERFLRHANHKPHWCVQYPWGRFIGNRLCGKHIVLPNNCSGRSMKCRACPIMICHARGARRYVKKKMPHPSQKNALVRGSIPFNTKYTQNIRPTRYVHQFCEKRRQIPLVFIGNLILSLFHNTSHGGTLTWNWKKSFTTKYKQIDHCTRSVFLKGSISEVSKI